MKLGKTLKNMGNVLVILRWEYNFLNFQSERASPCAYALHPVKSLFLVKWNLPVY